MSSLLVCKQRKHVVVVTDTLATELDGTPRHFTTKAFYVPHLRMIMAGTGLCGFLDRWFLKVNAAVLASGYDSLDALAPESLALLWDQMQSQMPSAKSITTTVYHFGFSDATGDIESFVYRSANGFRSESPGLPEYTFAKPLEEVPLNAQWPDCAREIMQAQRDSQAKRPYAERLHIGGEMIVHHLDAEQCATWSLGRFPEREDQGTTMLESAKERQEAAALQTGDPVPQSNPEAGTVPDMKAAFLHVSDSLERMGKAGACASEFLTGLPEPALVEIKVCFDAFTAEIQTFTSACKAFQCAAEQVLRAHHAETLARMN